MANRDTKIVNFYESTLAALLASGATSGTLTTAPTTNGTTKISASSGDSSTHYFLVIDPDNSANREVILVTQSTDETLTTIERDKENRHATDPNHQPGTTVRMAVLAEHFIDMNDRIDTFPTASSTTTFTNKTIDLTDNTVSATFAELNTAVSDATLVDLDDAQTLSNKTLSSVTLTDYAETDVAVTSTSNTIAIDLANGNTGSVTLGENVTDIDFTNVPANGTSSFTLKVTQDGTGSRTLAINKVTVNGGSEAVALTQGNDGITLTTAANSVDLVTFLFFDAGNPLVNALLDFKNS